jgi:hypothetical protein
MLAALEMERLESIIQSMRDDLTDHLDRIDTTLRAKQIEDAGRFVAIEHQLKNYGHDLDSLGSKVRRHLQDHVKWIFYPISAVAAILGLFKLLE